MTLILTTGCDSDDNDNNSKTTQTKTSASELIDTSYAFDQVNLPLKEVTFDNGTKLNFTWGIGSGAYRHANDPEDIIYTISDRGVNIKCADSLEIIGTELCEAGKIFPVPEFTPSILKLQLNKTTNEATILDIIELKDSQGKTISGVSNPLSNFSEIAYDIQW
jgi:hypothetical protein